MLLAVLAAGCAQEPSQAERIVAARETVAAATAQGFVRPPTTIADIVALLEAERPNSSARAHDRRTAEADEPAGLSPPRLVRFLIERGAARERMGLTAGAQEDVRLAAYLARSIRPRNLSLSADALGALADLEWNFGSPHRAYEIKLEQLDLLEGVPWHLRPNLPLPHFEAYINAVQYANVRGQAESERLLARAEQYSRSFHSHYRTNFILPIFQFQLDYTRAVHLDNFGSLAAAEAALRPLVGRGERLRADHVWGQLSPTHILAALPGERLVVNLRNQGRLAEAEAEARRNLLVRLQATGLHSTWGLRGLRNLASTLAAQGRGAEAERLQQIGLAAARMMELREESPVVVALREELAESLVAQGRWADALVQHAILQGVLLMGETRRERTGHNPNIIAAQIATGDAVTAAAAARAALAAGPASGAGLGDVTAAEQRALLGAALHAQGDMAGARRELDAAVPVLLADSATLARLDQGEGTAAGRRRRLIFEAHLEVLLAAHEAGDARAAELAFRVADAARGGQVRRALAAAAARSAAGGAGGAELAELARREQDAAEQAERLEATAAAMLAQPAAQRDARRIAALREQAAQLREARTALAAEIAQRFPRYAEMANPQPASLAQARAALRRGEALAAFYVGARRTYAFGLSQGGRGLAFAAAPLGEAELAEAIAALRAPLDATVTRASDLPAFDVAAAHRLHQALLAPLAAETGGAQALVVVPHRALGQLPFQLLVTAPPPAQPADGAGPRFAEYRQVAWLAKEAAVSQVPSVGALALLRALPPGRADRQPFLGFGDPWFNERQARRALAEGGEAMAGWRRAAPLAGVTAGQAGAVSGLGAAGPTLADLSRLPDTAQELRDVAAALGADPGRDVRLGRQAAERAVREADLARHRVVMFATHGLVPGELAGLDQPALALTPPGLAGGGAGDGLLTADEVLSLRLDADWVVLSACNTAAGGAGAAAAEAVSGLGRAFLYAGARALLVTNWAVDSVAARLLTTDLFRRQAERPGLTRAEALRQAMLALIEAEGPLDPETGRPAFSYAHPLFWAPYSLIGDGGG